MLGDAAAFAKTPQPIHRPVKDARQFCQQLVELVRALVILKVTEQPEDLHDYGEAELQELRLLAAPASLDDLQRLLSMLIRTEADLAVSNYPRLTMEMVLIRLSSLPQGIEVASLVKKLEALERRLAGGTLPAAPRSPVAPVAPVVVPIAPSVAVSQDLDVPPPPQEPEAPPVAPVALGEKSWGGLVNFINQRRRPMGSRLEHGRLLLLELPKLTIGFPKQYYNLVDNDLRDGIEVMAKEYFAAEVKIEFKLVNGEHAAPPSLHEERMQQESDQKKKLQDDAKQHPMV